MMDLIRNNSVSENEGHSILLCGKILPHIVEEKEKLYRFSIFPVVKEEEDTRKKYAD